MIVYLFRFRFRLKAQLPYLRLTKLSPWNPIESASALAYSGSYIRIRLSLLLL